MLFHERYEIITQIGKGGTSQVFEVEDRRLSMRFAMKRMAKARSSYQKAAFSYEIQLMSQLHHSCIPRIMDCFEDASYVYVVMELIEGASLLTIISKQGCLLQSQLLGWMEQICKLFLYLHTREPIPLLYLDLKPQNIMMDKTGRLYLIDFGSSCWINEIKVRSATPGYAPIELIEKKAPCFQSDIYSFGRTFYVLYHGHFPKEKHRKDALDKVLLKCCEESVAKRYKNFEQVHKEIVKLRIHNTRYALFLGICMLLCLGFLSAGFFCFQEVQHIQKQQYLSYMRQGKYEAAIMLKSNDVEPYRKLYEKSCEGLVAMDCEEVLQHIEEQAMLYHQEDNDEIALFMAMKYMSLDKREAYTKAETYFHKVSLKDENKQALVNNLMKLSIVLQQNEFSKKELQTLAKLLLNLEKSSVQIVDKQEAYQYQKLCMMIYENYHKDIVDSEKHLISMGGKTLSMMRKYPDDFTWKQREFIEEMLARGLYYQGLLYYETRIYDKMVVSYDKAIAILEKTQVASRYALLSDMEFECFVYGVKEVDKPTQLNRLKRAAAYAEKISKEDEKMYYLNKIQAEMIVWGL